MTNCSIRKGFPPTASYLKSTCYHQAFWKTQDPHKHKAFVLETQNIAHMNFRLGGYSTKPFSSPSQVKLQVWRQPEGRRNQQDAKVHSLSLLWLLLPSSIQHPQHLNNNCNAWELNQHRTIANIHLLILLHLRLIKLNLYFARTDNITFF